jgi:hypothetical protein
MVHKVIGTRSDPHGTDARPEQSDAAASESPHPEERDQIGLARFADLGNSRDR